MRREIYFLAALAFIGFLVSCGDDEEAPLEEQIIGTWTEIRFVVENCNDSSENEDFEISCDTLNCQKLIFSDSTLVNFFLQNGDTTLDENVYIIAANNIEICENSDLGASCIDFKMNITNDLLTLSPENEDGCEVRRQYMRD